MHRRSLRDPACRFRSAWPAACAEEAWIAPDERGVMARIAAAVLWGLLVVAAVLVVVMTWHPWVQPWTGVKR